MKYQIETYRNFGRCLRVEHGNLELYATLDLGPRIIRFNLIGHDNIFYEQPDELNELCSEGGWRLYGGHRLWVSPETDLMYWPDNKPVAYAVDEDSITFTGTPNEYQGLEMSITLRFLDDNTVSAEHTARKVSGDSMRCAAWALSVMDDGAVAHIPWKGTPGGLTPTRFLSLWSDTSLADERICFKDDKVIFSQLPHKDEYFKVGLWCGDMTAVCYSKGQAFIKTISVVDGAIYPDNHMNVEIFICRHMLEYETLGPLTDLVNIGDTCTHTEIWKLEKDNR